jgi:hypothetical protein
MRLAGADEFRTVAQVEKEFAAKLQALRGVLDSAKHTPPRHSS